MDVIGFGAINYDRLYKVSKIAKEDEEVFIETEHSACGGSAANTIYNLAKLKVNCGFIGAVGNDDEGREILEEFKKVGVDTSQIKIIENEKTGLILGFIDKNGERAMYASRRVNSKIEKNDFPLSYLENAKFLHFSSFVDNKQLEIQNFLAENKSNKTLISFAPGSLYVKKGIEKLEKILKNCHVLFLNKEEIEILTNNNYQKGAKILLELGCKIVAVTLKEKGCYLTDGIEKITVEPIPTDVVDTTGAGDAFSAGFLYGLLENKSLNECGIYGNFIASKCISKIGARGFDGKLDGLDLKKLS